MIQVGSKVEWWGWACCKHRFKRASAYRGFEGEVLVIQKKTAHIRLKNSSKLKWVKLGRLRIL